MQNDKKISTKAPSIKSNLDAFISGAEKFDNSYNNSSLPWKQNHVRKDIKKAFTVQLPEEYILKLQFIKEKTNQSQQRTVRDGIIQSVDRIIDDLINSEK